jgi:hypothetical protein
MRQEKQAKIDKFVADFKQIKQRVMGDKALLESVELDLSSINFA